MANLFNPNFDGGNPQQFLNYSRGVDVNTQGDTTAGKLLSGVGDMITLATKATSEAFDRTITQSVQGSVDQIRDEMGVSAATDTIGEAPGKTTPALLENGFRELERNTKAMQAGTLKDSYYWARLNSVARQLRSQFPGHREEIDQKISGMVGTTPANALIRSLQSEAAEAASKASSEENRFQTFFNTHLGKGNVDAMLAAAVQQGTVSRPKFVEMMAEKESSEKRTDLALKDLNLRKAAGEAVQTDGIKLMQRTVADGFNRQMTSQTEALGMSWSSLRNQINDINSGKVALTPEVQNALVTGFSMAEQLASQEAQKYRIMFNGISPPEETEKAINIPLNTIKEMKKAVSEGNISFIARNSLWLEAQKTTEQMRVLQNEDLGRVAAIKNVLGPELLTLVLPRDAENLDKTMFAIASYLTNGSLLGRSRSLVDSVAEAKSAVGAARTDTTVEKATVENAARLIAEPRIPEAQRTNLINDFFNEDNKRFIGAVPVQERPFIFSRMTTPAVEAKVVEMAKTNPELLRKYDSWVRHNAVTNSVPTLNKVSEFVSQRGQFVSISFNGTEFVATPKTLNAASDAIGQRTEETRAQHLVRDLNAYYKPLASMYEREGKGRDLAAYHLTNTVGLGSTFVPNALTTTKSGTGAPKGDSGDGGGDGDSGAPTGGSGSDSGRVTDDIERPAGMSMREFQALRATILQEGLANDVGPLMERLKGDLSPNQSKEIIMEWLDEMDKKKRGGTPGAGEPPPMS